jgi:GNAT superfamily N-acetyltransferase
MTPPKLNPPMPINSDHRCEDFDSGVLVLDDWLKKRALKNQASGASRTYVVTAEDHAVAGYYCLAAGAVTHGQAPKPLRRNMPDPIPVIVLGRLAIDHRYQRLGLGRGLLKDAVLRTIQASGFAGIRAILVHAISEDAKRFYLSCGFLESPTQPMTLCLPLETARKVILED